MCIYILIYTKSHTHTHTHARTHAHTHTHEYIDIVSHNLLCVPPAYSTPVLMSVIDVPDVNVM